MIYVTQRGDVLDAVCRAHYGEDVDAVAAVLDANPGLAKRGPVLPFGQSIVLPDMDRATPETDMIHLWS